MSPLVSRPTRLSAPPAAREAGAAPFWCRGGIIGWHYRRPDWNEGEPSDIAPLRVVRDDERGLVAWLAAGTVREAAVAEDGRELRSIPLEERWLRPRSSRFLPWRGNGILRIAPVGVPWSVWLFWSPGDAEGGEWRFTGWYVNLENSHLRCGHDTFSTDHILDVDISAEGRVSVKDEDELGAAVIQGRFSATEAEQIRSHADAAIASFRSGDWPFAPEWRSWRPDPSWQVPTLS